MSPRETGGLLVVAKTGFAAVLVVMVSLSVGTSNAAQNTTDMDRTIQEYAFKSFRHPRTGVIIDVSLPASLQGVQSKAVRLRSGSFRRRGFQLQEFSIPAGARVATTQEPVRVVLVYRSVSGSSRIYSPAAGYSLATPVLGVRVYDAANLAATALPRLNLVVPSGTNVTIQFGIPAAAAAAGLTPLCASFASDGNMTLLGNSSSGTCSTNRLDKDFALVLPQSSLAPSPSPSPTPSPSPSLPPAPASATPSPASSTPGEHRSKGRSKNWKVILGSVLGAVGGLLLLSLLALCALRSVRSSRISKMQRRSDRGEALQSSLIGGSRAPTAGATRTQPVLESEYAA